MLSQCDMNRGNCIERSGVEVLRCSNVVDELIIMFNKVSERSIKYSVEVWSLLCLVSRRAGGLGEKKPEPGPHIDFL